MIALWLLPLAYATLMSSYYLGWRSVPVWATPTLKTPTMSVTVIIAARNEAAYIVACLQSILDNRYPTHLLEIIVVNDHSEDQTADLVLKFAIQYPRVRLVNLVDYMGDSLPQGHKKKSISVAIQQATSNLIVTTDADCEVSKTWLPALVSVFEAQEHIQLVTAPVQFYREKNLLGRFQSLDFLGLMGITAAGIYSGWQRMGNGANLAYRKSVFTAVNGYEGNTHITSGDDMFLIQKVAQVYPDGVFFLKTLDALVFTEPKPDIGSFISQRLRWGTKNAALPEWPIRLALILVFLFCWAILALGIGSIFWVGYLPYFIGFCFSKMFFDYIFLREMCLFFDRRDLLRSFFASFWLHTTYIALIGLGSLIWTRYTWKSREEKAIHQ